MNDDWEWDETLFEGAAASYEQGRPPYAPGLVPLPAEVPAADGQGRLLDVGCGPGTVAIGMRCSSGVNPQRGRGRLSG
ncbi:hypothetical protein [Streptomyces sp. NPDC007205]|uniref:hypothetical protein n=1 Tax=Streptomyces sp. NPDC007205 TaxID=3154316 RepID=UPI0033F8714E